MNKLLESLERETNYCYTENHALAHKSTLSAVYDMFALGAAYRQRSVEDRINLFKKALDEDEVLALKCLFYARDVRGGQGEREFFRNCIRWLANYKPEVVIRNLDNIPEFGRYDDLYCLIDTPAEEAMWNYLKQETKKGIEELNKIF